MEFLTSTIIAGLIYDLLKLGTVITAKNIKGFFLDNLYEISNDEARTISTQAQNINIEETKNLSKEDFITHYENIFTTTNNLNQVVNSNNYGGQSFNAQQQTINLVPTEKKTN